MPIVFMEATSVYRLPLIVSATFLQSSSLFVDNIDLFEASYYLFFFFFAYYT